MDLYRIDVTGDDILSKNYGIIVLFSNEQNEYAYAFKFSQDLQKEIKDFHKAGLYGIKCSLKPKVYSVVLSCILRKITREQYTSTSRFVFHICNDFHQSITDF